jgi:outer membrane protein assembly factor BamA
VAYGLSYAERDQIRLSAEVTRRNLAGLDRSLSTFARASFRGSRFLTTYREPYLLGRRQDLFVTGFREEEDRPGFDFVRFGSLVQTARALSPRFSLILRYTFQETSVFNVEVPGGGPAVPHSTVSGHRRRSSKTLATTHSTRAGATSWAPTPSSPTSGWAETASSRPSSRPRATAA